MIEIIREHESDLEKLAYTGTALSFLGSLFIFWSYCVIKGLNRSPAFRMIFHLSITDFLLTINGIINVNAPEIEEDHPKFCQVWGFARGYISLSSMFWPFAFAHSMHCFYNGSFRSQNDWKKKIKYYKFFCWGLPIAFAVLPLFFNAYGASDIYCWLKVPDLPGKTQQELMEIKFWLAIISYYGPVTIIVLLMLFYYIKIIRYLIMNPSSEANTVFYSLFFYPLIVMITYFFSVGDRFINIPSGHPTLFMIQAHLILRQLQGFLNAVVYCMGRKFREKFKKHFSHRRDQKNKKFMYYSDHDSMNSSNSDSSFLNISSFHTSARSPMNPNFLQNY